MLIGIRPKMVVNRVRDFLLSRLGNDTVHYVQVGANDGFLDDPVYKIAEARNWSGLLIEPNPAYFADLSKRYESRDGFKLVNCGVSDKSGTLNLYHLSEAAEAKFPAWARGCATLDRERLEKVLSRASHPDPDDIVSTSVQVRKLDSILKSEKITRTDLLVVDVEGHEIQVLNSVNLKKLRPKAILVESNSAETGQDDQICAFLTSAGYTLHRLGDDIFGHSDEFPAVDPSEMLALIGLMRIG